MYLETKYVAFVLETLLLREYEEEEGGGGSFFFVFGFAFMRFHDRSLMLWVLNLGFRVFLIYGPNIYVCLEDT